MANKDDDKPFKVEDRRRFTETGESRPGAGEREASADGATAAERPMETGDGATAVEQPGDASSPIDFLSFVFSLGSSVLMYLGEAPNPETGQVEKNLPLARETIDVLALLQEKTKGNLTPEEDRFLGSLLYDLRLRFVQANK